MDKITKKFIKYFIFIIIIVISICFLLSSLFLSNYYLNQKYSSLKKHSEEIYSSLKSGNSYNIINVNALLIKNSELIPLTKGKMGMHLYFKSIDYKSLPIKGKIKNNSGETFLYYKLNSDLGYIFVFENAQYSSNYLEIIYLILLLVFITALVLSIPLISYIGKKFTKPILKLKNASLEIKKGNFSVDMSVSSNDEIQDLSKSLRDMALSLEEKQTLQRDFIANVSHDFKTPLSIIRNYSEAIYDDILSPEDKHYYAKEIMSEVDKLNSLVMDILQLSKLQNNKFKLNKNYINLYDFLINCINKLKKISLKKEIIFKFHFAIPKDTYFLGDELALSRVLYNFLDNAIKFSPDQSPIDIICKKNIDNSLYICIKDYGEGIADCNLQNIWTKYYKDLKSGGMGLGLPICSEILKLHEFPYGVKSTLSKGSEFYFYIPSEFIQ